MASHAVVLLNHPPAFLNIMPRITGLVLIALRQGSLLASHQERSQRPYLLLRKVQVRHAEFFFLRLVVFLALVEDVRLGHLVLEESLLCVPGIFCWALGQAS